MSRQADSEPPGVRVGFEASGRGEGVGGGECSREAEKADDNLKSPHRSIKTTAGKSFLGETRSGDGKRRVVGAQAGKRRLAPERPMTLIVLQTLHFVHGALLFRPP
jgi:hypothetical protein